MLWGATLRSPHPRARHRVDRHRAGARDAGRPRRAHPRRRARPQTYGMEIPDQPVLAGRRSATRARPSRSSPPTIPRPPGARSQAIEVEYEVARPPLTDPEEAMEPDAPQLHRAATSCGTCASTTAIRTPPRRRRRHRHLRGRDAGPGVPRPESGLAVPDGEGGVDLHVATQWLHVDRDQVAASLGLPHERVRLAWAASAARSAAARTSHADPRLHARAAHRPAGEDGVRPRGVVLRPRPPPPGADVLRARRRRARQRCVYVEARGAPRRRRVRVIVAAVASNAACFAAGPYAVPNARIDAYVAVHQQPALRRDARLRRGAGRVRARGADGQAGAGPRHDPVELRIKNAMEPGEPDADRSGGPGARAGR